MKRTALYQEHIKLNGKMVEFAGWELPVYYTSIVEEHLSVRNQCGIFDVSHLGRIEITGEDAQALIQYISTNDVTKLTDWNIQYSLVCREDGGILDDILIYKYPDHYLLVVNASNTQTILDVIQTNAKGRKVQIKDITPNTSMIAVQGPKAIHLIEKYFSTSFSHIKKYSFMTINDLILSRTGYTGEDGFEITCPNEKSFDIWNKLLVLGKEFGLIPSGLGARDTLRLEAGNCLYGHEMDVSTNPYEAGLSFVVKLAKNDFIGKNALLKIKENGIKKKLIGLEMCNNSIPRSDYSIQKAGHAIGKITSGTYSPVLKKGIALAYVPVSEAELGNELEVIIRDKVNLAKVVEKKWR